MLLEIAMSTLLYIHTSNLLYSASRMLIGLTVMRRFLYKSPTARL